MVPEGSTGDNRESEFRRDYDFQDVLDGSVFELIEQADRLDDMEYLVRRPASRRNGWHEFQGEEFNIALRMPLPPEKEIDDLGEIQPLRRDGKFRDLPRYTDGEVVVRTGAVFGRPNQEEYLLTITWKNVLETEGEFREAYQKIADTTNNIYRVWSDFYRGTAVENLLEDGSDDLNPEL